MSKVTNKGGRVMSLDEVMKVIPEGQWICVNVVFDDAATQYFYPPKEEMFLPWHCYRVLKIESIRPSGLVITVEEVDEDAKS